ncbi:MAG TPA: ABC transporter permease subunit [Devosiaceae bacterium]|jgi:iron(III) transport system permease protein
MTAVPLSAKGNRHRRMPSFFTVVAVGLSAAVAALVLFPVVTMLVRTLFAGGHFQAALFVETLGADGLWTAMRNTIVVAVVVNIIAVPIGAIFAWFSFRTDARMGFLATLLPVIPLLIPNVAMTIGWVFLASPDAGFLTAVIRAGLGVFGIGLDRLPISIFSWPGLILLYVLHVVPVVYVIAAAAYRSVDPLLEEAARLNGSGVWKTFWTVSLPAIRQALLLSGLLVTVLCFGIYSVPAVIASPARIPILSVYAVRLINGQTPPAIGSAVVLSLCLMVIVGALWLLQQKLSVPGRNAQIGGMGVRPNVVRLGPMKWVARTAMLAYAIATSLLPMIALFIVSLQPFWTPSVNPARLNFSNFVTLFSTAYSRNAVFNSLLLAITGSFILLLTMAVLMLYADAVKGGWARAIGLITKAPAALSHLVIAIGMYATFAVPPLNLGGTVVILLLTYMVLYMPQASIVAEASARQIGGQLAEASRMSGAGGGRTFWEISLPLMIPGLAAGWALIFTDIIGELTASVILAGPQNPVIGYVIMDIYDAGTYAQLAALAAVITVLSTITVAMALFLSRPRFGGARS